MAKKLLVNRIPATCNLAESYGAELVTYDNATNDQYLTDVANGRTDVILNDYYLQKKKMAVACFADIPVKILEDVYLIRMKKKGFLFVKRSSGIGRKKWMLFFSRNEEDGRLKNLRKRIFSNRYFSKI